MAALPGQGGHSRAKDHAVTIFEGLELLRPDPADVECEVGPGNDFALGV